MRRISDPKALAWLAERSPQGSNVTGFDAGGWDATAWILHAMYETADLPAGITYDDVHRMERATGVTEPVMIGEVDLEEVLADAQVVGSALGRSEWPGPGWERLRWSELAQRLDMDPFTIDVPPCLRSFPYTSWPANIAPPGEGSLDREQFLRLLEHLAAITPEGDRESCSAFYAMVMVEQDTIYTCELRQLIDLYDQEDLPGSPSNIWPRDRSWFLYTDADLWATKVSGRSDLIERLLADRELEAVLLRF